NNILYKQYKNDYSKIDVVNKFEEFIPDNINSVIPSKIYNYFKIKYNYFKPYFINFNLRDFFNTKDMLLSVNKNVCDDNEFTYNRDDKMGIGGSEPITFIGEIKSDDNNIQYIRDSKIKLISPTNGVITSPFGTRDEIWKGIETYHYGVDIGNKLNTEVFSSSDGVVCKVEKNNKYYGNFVIIENNNITFKYAHLNKILVNDGDKIKFGDKIGLMGNTGLSTGTHLHFEIRVKGVAVNPLDVVNI
ncbi:MAG: M23 family metallopeptidase, partial [Clostridia bacterium]